MYRVLLDRLVLAAVTLLGVAVIVFVLVRVVPGDPVAMMIAPGAGEAEIAALRARYGLDEPIWAQFSLWLQQAISGDFGTSISLRQDVVELILSRLPATLELSFIALIFAVILGGSVGLLASAAHGNLFGWLIDNINGLLLAVPDFIWALAFILMLGVLMPVFPISGRVDPRLELDYATDFYLLEAFIRIDPAVLGNILSHMIMPALALGLPLAAVIARVLKNSMIEALRQDYILMARIKGLGETRILLSEALRNAVLPTFTLTGVQFAFLIGGTVIIERIFSYPGIGNMAIDAVINRDLPLIQGLVLTFGLLFIFINLTVDLCVALINPRLRHG